LAKKKSMVIRYGPVFFERRGQLAEKADTAEQAGWHDDADHFACGTK
jgi:hypothetical protein